MPRAIFSTIMLSMSALVATLIAAPASRAHCSPAYRDGSMALAAAEPGDTRWDLRAQFDILQVQDASDPNDRGNRRFGARSGGSLGSFGGGSLGASVDHGIGTYRGGGLGALGEGQGGPATDAVRQIPSPPVRVGERQDAGRQF